MNREKIRATEKVIAAHVSDAGLVARLRREILAPGDDVHFEGAADLGHVRAELAKAEQGKRHAFKVKTDRGLPECSGFETGVLVTNAAGEVEHQAGRDGSRAVAEGGRSADNDATLFCGIEVDRRVAH